MSTNSNETNEENHQQSGKKIQKLKEISVVNILPENVLVLFNIVLNVRVVFLQSVLKDF